MKTKYNAENIDTAKKNKRKKRLTIALLVIFIAIPTLTVCISLCAFSIWANTVQLNESLLPTASAMPTFFDIDNQKIPYYADDYVKVEEVPKNLANAFVALEDKRFYSHKGYDITRIFGAIAHNIKSRSLKEGASTITQQLVKNTHLSQERTLKRKLNEIAIAIKLEKRYSKDEILSMYLSVIYFGNGAYGVKSAANLYFGKSLDELTLGECATLAGIVKNPKKYSPKADNKDCTERRNLVLRIMKEQDYITENEYLNALNEEISTSPKQKEKSDYVLYIKNACEEVCKTLNITTYQLNNSGYNIYLNLDMSVQSALSNEAQNNKNYESENVESVSIVLDNTKNAVIALHSTLPYNVKRQAGSVLKPIAVYAPALNENLVSLATPIVDEKVNFNGYEPKNFGDVYYGETTIRDGLKKSMNSVSVKVLDYLGLGKSTAYLNRFGIELLDEDKNYALALGATSRGVSPIQVANAYKTFANDGWFTNAKFIRYVTQNDKKIYQNNDYLEYYHTFDQQNIIEASTSSLISSALVDCVKDGTAKTLSALNFEVACKTGTAQRTEGQNSDAWSASFNDNFTVVVWHGNDVGMKEKGGGYPTMHALKIWQNLSNKYSMPRSIKIDSSVVSLDVDTYATSKDKTVVLASPNTPKEYRKSELFCANKIPSAISCCFDSIQKLDFDIKVKANAVELSLQPEKIYTYRIYRNDNVSRVLIAEIDGKHTANKQNNDAMQVLLDKNTTNSLLCAQTNVNGVITITDRPLCLWGYVSYEVECFLTHNPQISKVEERQVYLKSPIM